MQHLPPPPSPGMGGNTELPLPGHGYGGRGSNTNNTNNYGSSWRSNSNNYSVDTPSSPAAHLYSTPPTSRKSFRGFNRGMRRGRSKTNEEEEDDRFGFNAHAGSGSPPPLSTFYDGPLDGSLGLSQEEDREEEEERYDNISSYRRDAGFKDSGLGSGGSLISGTLGPKSRKRTWASTLDEDEWYENGRGGLVKGGSATGANGRGGTEGGQGGQEERGQGGGGKRRIIDVVGSVASRLWEVVKGNASWGFYYPVAIVKGVGSAGSSGREQREQQQQQGEEDDAARRISSEFSRGLAARLNIPQGQGYSSTSGPMANNTSTAASLPQRPSSSSSRRSTLSTPDSPTKSRRRANTSFTRNNNNKKPPSSTTANSQASTVASSLKDLDTDSGLRASWVLVPQQEFTPTAASLPSSTCRPRVVPAPRLNNPNQGHSRSASSTTQVMGKKRPFRYPVHVKPTSAHVSFEVPGAPGGRRGRKKSLSWGGTGAWGEEQIVFGGSGGDGGGAVVGLGGEDEDEVDESMRRWNERLRNMIREGREALGSKVEVLYEDGV